ncbi:MFS transporter [Streptomyces sp. NPDC098781]|uniref:MFS transporter n=1 Tax=Streptomyces sp. NPDC098781 TaxID=3366097 RepID=UPI003829C1FA
MSDVDDPAGSPPDTPDVADAAATPADAEHGAIRKRARAKDGGNRLIAAAGVSALGDGLRATALPLLAVTYTTDPALLALVTVAGTVPMLLSPLAGVAADRWPRRALMVWLDVGRAVIVGLVALMIWTKSDDLAMLYAAAFLLGVGETVFGITAQAYLPQVVPEARLTSANGRLQAVQLIFLDTVGQPLGGLLFAVSAALPFLLDAASFAIGVMVLLTVHSLSAAPATSAATPAAGTGTGPAPKPPGWGEMVRDGFRYLRRDRLLMLLALMLGWLNFFFAGVSAILVLYVLEVLDLGTTAYGFFLAVAALGGLVGGLAASRLRERFGTFPVVSTALAALGAACLLMGLVHHPVAGVAGFFALNLAAVVYQALTVAFRQTTVAREVIGRINGVYRLIGTGGAPLGAVCAGLVAGQAEIWTPFVVSGAALLLLAAVTWRPLRRLGGPRGAEAEG